MTEEAKPAGPLSGLRVVDLTQALAGPYATQILGDLGAEVIKVETPEGDITRRLPPHFIGKESAYYLSVNRNKHSIAIDLKAEAGKTLMRDLCAASDAVIENFRPGVLDRLGLSYAGLSAAKPGLIWCSISGFGQEGPYRDRPAYDMIVQAMSGSMSITGEPNGPAVRSGVPLGDIAAGLYAVIGLLAALEERRRTGRGKFVDVAMLDCQVAMLSYQAAYYLASGNAPNRQGRGHDSIPTYRSFSCRDGHEVVITAITERMWQQLCRVLERPALLEDSRFQNNELRFEHRAALWPLLEAAFAERDAAQWVPALIEAEIPAAMVNTLHDSLNDPHVRHRNMVIELAGPAGEHAQVAGNPIKFRGQDETPPAYPPALGEDQDKILTEVLGLSEAQIAELRRGSVIGPRR